MRLIKVTGGLGNQMFIYAFYLRMKKYYPKVRIDLSDMMHYKVHYGYEMHRVFNLPHTEFCINQPLKKVIEFLFFKKIYERKQAPNSLRAFEKKYFWPLLYFKGFYQSERFFADIKDEVRESFTFDKNKANSRSLNMLEILDKDENAVAEMSRRVASPSYYIFSDDIAWVKENLPLQNAVYIDWNTDEDSWQDMMLMSHCKHHIICNSTFSWWGAWLNPNMDKTVIVPSRWFQHSEAPDIYPTGWIKVPVS